MVPTYDEICLSVQSTSQEHLILRIIRDTPGHVRISYRQQGVMFQEGDYLFNLTIPETIGIPNARVSQDSQHVRAISRQGRGG